MNHLLTMPFVFHGQTNNYLLQLDPAGDLSSTRFSLTDDHTTTTLIQSDCTGFCAAGSSNEQLHILTATKENRLKYYLLTGDDLQQLPFFVQTAPPAFTLTFTGSGQGYYCAEGQGRLIFALLPESGEWQFYELLNGQQPVPLAMAVDLVGYVHLLLFDRSEKLLYYQSLEPKTYRTGRPFALASNYNLLTVPAFLLDSVQNLHLAWQEGDSLHYQARLAGDWPSRGWKHKITLPLRFSVQLLSSTEKYPQPELWLLDENKIVHYYNPLAAAEKSQSSASESFIPVRCAQLTNQQIRLLKQTEGTAFFASVIKALQEETQIQTSRQEEEESPLFLHARRLMAEKKRLEYELSKKEASLAQLQHMLELAQENNRKHSIAVNEKLYEINKRSRELQQKNNQLEQELQALQTRLAEVQEKLSQADAVNNEQRKQLTRLRNELVTALNKEKEQNKKIALLEAELANKRGVWDTITGMFQNKTSAKK